MKQANDLQEDLIRAFEQACRNAGLRLTHQRLEIFRELAGASDHPSAETLHRRLLKKIPTLSLDTVYRTLATFADHDLIRKIDTVESQARFEATVMRHHHLICNACKEIMDFHWQEIDETPLPRAIDEWGHAAIRNVVIRGICKKCL